MTAVRVNNAEEAKLLRTRGQKNLVRPVFVRDGDGAVVGVEVDLPAQAAAQAQARIDAHRAAPPGPGPVG